jgi:predicted P-loop ATPase
VRRVITPEQEGRYEADVWEEAIKEYVKGQDRVTVTQIARLALGFDVIAKVGTADQRRIAAVLKALGGWKPGKDYRGRFYEKT